MAQQKVSFKKWWKNITGTKATKGLFHIELVDSIVYAGVPVHYTVNGQTRCQGYIPTIVSKCGWYLKEQATRAKGIFRVSGSAKRVSELQLIFDTPPKYGSQLDWSGYTIHDASNVLRRYLNHLPDPVIPLEFYEKFRDVHRNLTDEDEQIAAYQELISKLPPPHSCLLMYLLDLLALFAHHSEENLMDSKNLASVFQPGVISHPGHSMSPGEYMTSAAVLKFLIDHQSSFTMPKPNIDEEDEEMANFGLMDQPPQHRLPINNRDSFGAAFRAGGYVNASDHERIHNTMVDRGVSFEADDAVHILNSGVRRQLSLHKPIIPHSTLPGNPPQRSKSTNSSTSSHHSNHSGLFSSSFLARRRSNRNSKTGSKIMGEGENFSSLNTVPQEQDLSDVPENARLREEKQRSSTSRTSSVRKAATSPLIGVDESGSELTSYLSRRKQMKAEGLHREPSLFCQTIEVQFQAPVIDGLGQPSSFQPFVPTRPTISTAQSQPTILSRGDRTSQNIGDSTSARDRDRTRTSLISSTPLGLSNMPTRQRDSNPHLSQPLSPQKPSTAVKRTSGTGQSFHAHSSRASPSAAECNAAAANRPVNPGMLISRAKSNPGDLTTIGTRNSSGLQTAGGNQTMEKLKGLFSGKHRDQEATTSTKDDGNKERMRDSLPTDKQRKYRSQELVPVHLHQSSGTALSGWRGAPVHGTIDEHETSYMQSPPSRPQLQQLHSAPTPPIRPPPPGPEGSLMDLLDPPQRLGGHYSGHSSPSGGSRSASPARTTSSPRQQLPANASFTSSSSARSVSSGDRLYQQGRSGGLVSHGSSSSLEYVAGHSDDPHNNPRQRSPRNDTFPHHRHPSHSPSHSQSQPDLYSPQSQQHLSPYGPSSHHRHHGHPLLPPQPHASYSSNPITATSNSSSSTVHDFGGPYSTRPYASSSRSRQDSSGSLNNHSSSNDVYHDTHTHAPPTPTPKSRHRRLPRERSTSSVRGAGRDETPPLPPSPSSRARSNSSKNSSPIHSPALTPLSRNASSQSLQSGSGSGSGHGYGHYQQLQHHHHHHAPSPLAERQDTSSSSNYVNLPPSSRARSRAQSRDEQHFLHRQESATSQVSIGHHRHPPGLVVGNSGGSGGSGAGGGYGTSTSRPYYERERSRSGTGFVSSTSSATSSPALPPVNLGLGIGGVGQSVCNDANQNRSQKQQ